METKNYQHTTVLLHEAVDELLQASVDQDPVFVDGTFGRGGHSRLILSQLPAHGRLIAFDKDVEAIAEAILTLKHDADLRGAMGRAARVRALGFTWGHYRDRLGPLLDRLLGIA